ncbi:hypothetical protein K438DRAFT_1817219 [Mycena galopus ATCC 62051]|nr:hypothetical protein K438DRAFT_1817219 [Mycena galopus ATCC 62051]
MRSELGTYEIDSFIYTADDQRPMFGFHELTWFSAPIGVMYMFIVYVYKCRGR